MIPQYLGCSVLVHHISFLLSLILNFLSFFPLSRSHFSILLTLFFKGGISPIVTPLLHRNINVSDELPLDEIQPFGSRTGNAKRVAITDTSANCAIREPRDEMQQIVMHISR